MMSLAFAILRFSVASPGVIDAVVGSPPQRVRLAIDFSTRDLVLFPSKVNSLDSKSITHMYVGHSTVEQHWERISSIEEVTWMPFVAEAPSPPLHTMYGDEIDGIFGVHLDSHVWRGYNEMCYSPLQVVFSNDCGKTIKVFGKGSHSQWTSIAADNLLPVTPPFPDRTQFMRFQTNQTIAISELSGCVLCNNVRSSQEGNLYVIDMRVKDVFVTDMFAWHDDAYFLVLRSGEHSLAMRDSVFSSMSPDNVTIGDILLLRHSFRLRPYGGHLDVVAVQVTGEREHAIIQLSGLVTTAAIWLLIRYGGKMQEPPMDSDGVRVEQAAIQSHAAILSVTYATLAAFSSIGTLSIMATSVLELLIGGVVFKIVVICALLSFARNSYAVVAHQLRISHRGIVHWADNMHMLHIITSAIILCLAFKGSDIMIIATMSAVLTLIFGYCIAWMFANRKTLSTAQHMHAIPVYTWIAMLLPVFVWLEGCHVYGIVPGVSVGTVALFGVLASKMYILVDLQVSEAAKIVFTY